MKLFDGCSPSADIMIQLCLPRRTSACSIVGIDERRVAARTCSVLIPGLYKVVPTPKPLALPDIQAAKFSGTHRRPHKPRAKGIRARIARCRSVPRTEQGNISSIGAALRAGSIRTASARPARTQALALLSQARHRRRNLARRRYSHQRPRRRGPSFVRTVPAPIVACLPNLSTRRAMLSKGRGELSGISIVVMPPAIRISTTASASSGVIPRRMAMRLRLMVRSRGKPRSRP